MGTPVESHMDELAFQTTIDDYGDMSIVTIPGCADLSQSERLQIMLKARSLHTGSSRQADSLREALRDVTPPLDEQAENEDSCRREARARQELEDDGCPPCYPPGVDIPLLGNLPEECQAIVGYWNSFPGTGDVPLCAQLIAWRRFRALQQQTRVHRFEDFEHEVRERRQRHGLNCNVCLTVELEQQSPLERWIEFQNYQLARLEVLQRKCDRLKKELTESRTADNTDAVTHLVECAERDIKRHMVLLHWIEQKRQAMHPGGDATASSNIANTVVQSTSPRVRRRKRAKIPPPILGKGARISKPHAPRKRKPRHQMAARQVPAPEPEPKTVTIKNSDVIPRTAIPRKPKKPLNAKSPNKTGRSEDDSLLRRQLSPQRVAKRQTRSCGLALAKQPETVRRSGRTSKPPERWVPV